MALLVEHPFYRGRADGGCLNPVIDDVSKIRRLQACRLRESGWSVQGLATLFDVSFESVEYWLHRTPTESIRRPKGGKRSVEEKIDEALILIRMGFWPLKQPTEARVRRGRAKQLAYVRRKRPPKTGRTQGRSKQPADPARPKVRRGSPPQKQAEKR